MIWCVTFFRSNSFSRSVSGVMKLYSGTFRAHIDDLWIFGPFACQCDNCQSWDWCSGMQRKSLHGTPGTVTRLQQFWRFVIPISITMLIEIKAVALSNVSFQHRKDVDHW